VKRVYFVLLLMMMIVAASCSSASKSQKTDSVVPETSASEAPPESKPEIPEEIVDAADTPISDEKALDVEDTVDEEPVLAKEEPPVEVVEPESPPITVIVPEPEPPVVAVAPEPAPPQAAEPPPPERPVPRPEPPRVITPPPAAAKPPAEPPPPVAPSVEEKKPPVEEKPPAIVQEPPLRNIPELPNPTPGLSGRQDAAQPMVFSRVVRATVGQLVEVPFRGTGWVYLGEVGARRGIVYDSRRLEPDGQSFIFRTERVGEYALKFYRQDFIRDFIINDYVQVIVGAPSETAGSGWFNPPIDRGRVIAEPRWPSALAEAQSLRADNRPAQPDVPAAASPAAGSTVNAPASTAPVQPSTSPPAESPVQSQSAGSPVPSVTPPATPSATRPATTPTAPPTATPPAAVPDASKNAAPELSAYTDPSEYLEKAKEEFAAGRVASAISFLDRFCDHYPSGTDETWWLYGQFYEANSPSRNILTALNCYRRLVQEYPQSSRFDDARKRIAYLQRYYININ